jgi:hypothetical protein
MPTIFSKSFVLQSSATIYQSSATFVNEFNNFFAGLFDDF